MSVARSCRPRRSRSDGSAGTTKSSSTVRSSAQPKPGRPPPVLMTRMPSRRLPTVIPLTAVGRDLEAEHEQRPVHRGEVLRVLRAGMDRQSVPRDGRDDQLDEHPVDQTSAARRLPRGATDIGPSFGKPCCLGGRRIVDHGGIGAVASRAALARCRSGVFPAIFRQSRDPKFPVVPVLLPDTSDPRSLSPGDQPRSF